MNTSKLTILSDSLALKHVYDPDFLMLGTDISPADAWRSTRSAMRHVGIWLFDESLILQLREPARPWTETKPRRAAVCSYIIYDLNMLIFFTTAGPKVAHLTLSGPEFLKLLDMIYSRNTNSLIVLHFQFR